MIGLKYFLWSALKWHVVNLSYINKLNSIESMLFLLSLHINILSNFVEGLDTSLTSVVHCNFVGEKLKLLICCVFFCFSQLVLWILLKKRLVYLVNNIVLSLCNGFWLDTRQTCKLEVNLIIIKKIQIFCQLLLHARQINWNFSLKI